MAVNSLGANSSGTSPSPSSSLRVKKDEYGGVHYSVAKSLNSTKMDPSEYADAMAGMKRAEAQQYTDKVSSNLNIISQLKELKNKLAAVQSSAQQLANYLGADANAANLWKEKLPSTLVDTVTGATVGQLVKVTATKDASIGNFTLQVTQLASSDFKKSTLVTISDPTTPLGFSGNLNIGGQAIAVSAGQSLNDIMNTVNQLSSTTNVKMSVIPIDGTNYTFQLTSTLLGAPIDISASDAPLATSLGLVKDTVVDADTLNLQMTYNGQTIKRTSSNLVSDLIPGITIEVYGKTTNPVIAKIDYDRISIQKGIFTLVDSYNDLQKFAKEQTKNNVDGTPAEGAYLHKSNALQSALQSAATILTSWVNSNSTLPLNNLGAIGLNVGQSTFDSASKTMTGFSRDIAIDQNKIDQLINSDKLSDVMTVLGNKATSSNAYFTVYGIPNFQNASNVETTEAGWDVTVSLQKVGGVVTASFSDGTTTTTATLVGDNLIAGTGGGVIQGPVGSIFEGFSIGVKASVVTGLVNNGAAATTTVNATQGIFAALEKSMGSFLAQKIGAIDVEIEQLETQNKRSTDAANTLESQAKKEYDRVLNSFNQIRLMEAQFEQFTKQMEEIMALLTARR